MSLVLPNISQTLVMIVEFLSYLIDNKINQKLQNRLHETCQKNGVCILDFFFFF